MSTMTRAPKRAAGTHAPACASDPERMHPVDESERPGQRTAGEAWALEVCAVCPLLTECRAAAVGLGSSAPLAYGVAGGLTREDRRAIRAEHQSSSQVAAGVSGRLTGDMTVGQFDTAGEAA